MKYKPLANPKGSGVVYKGDEELAQISYELIIKQEVHITEDGNEVEGSIDQHGEIFVLEGRKNLYGMEKLTLRLEDGRYIDFFLGRIGDETIGKYHIVPSGNFRNEL
jgi:hypothetical protein